MDYILHMQDGTELYHHGIKGQKWGVRRYQNPDGSLTAEGMRRYSEYSGDELQKKLYKQVKKKRAEQRRSSGPWLGGRPRGIGEYSKVAIDKYYDDRKKHEESEVYKKADKKLKLATTKWNLGKMSDDDYDKIVDEFRSVTYKPELANWSVIGSDGRKYVNEYLEKYGRDINIGYLKDLGYNDAAAKMLTDKIMKDANKKMLNGL